MLKKSIRILTIAFFFAFLLIAQPVYAEGDYDSPEELETCVKHIKKVYGGEYGEIVKTVQDGFEKAQTDSSSDIIEARCRTEVYSLYLQYLTLNEYADRFDDVVGDNSLLNEKNELKKAGESIGSLKEKAENEHINYYGLEEFLQQRQELESELYFIDLSLTSKLVAGEIIDIRQDSETQEAFEKRLLKAEGRIEEKSERFEEDWKGRALSEFPYYPDEKGNLFFTEDGKEANDLKESDKIVEIENVPVPGIENKVGKKVRVTISTGAGEETTTGSEKKTSSEDKTTGSSTDTTTGTAKGSKEEKLSEASFWQSNKYLIIAAAAGVVCIIIIIILVMNASAKRKRALNKKRIEWKPAQDDFEDGIIYSNDDEIVQKEIRELAQEEGITLHFEMNDGSKISHHLTREMVVGRGSECEIVVNQPIFSREHFLLEWDGESVYIEDLETKNGTKVNGSLLRHKRRIESGDIVGVGNVEITIRWYG